MNLDITWFDNVGIELCRSYDVSWDELKSAISRLVDENDILLDDTIFEPARPNTAMIQPLAGSINVKRESENRENYRQVELFRIAGLKRTFISVDRVTVGVAYPKIN